MLVVYATNSIILYSLVVMIVGFHPTDRGSNPRGGKRH